MAIKVGICSPTSYDASDIQDANKGLLAAIEEADLFQTMKEFENKHKENYQLQFLLLYMDMVERLLQFIASCRSRNWAEVKTKGCVEKRKPKLHHHLNKAHSDIQTRRVKSLVTSLEDFGLSMSAREDKRLYNIVTG